MTVFQKTVNLPLVLVGPPASGKSTIGMLLSKRFGIPCYDLDRLIEEQYRVSIHEFFSLGRISYFRLLETQCLESLWRRAKPHHFVLATGGGTVLLKKNRMILKKLGRSVYLKSSCESLAARILALETPHPLFRSQSIEQEVRKLLNAREKYYMESDWVLDTEGQSQRQVFKTLLERTGYGQR